MITVVKLGGSLNDDPRLPAWLALLASAGAGRVVLVPGGGRYADEVRRAQAHWRFDDLSAHNMAVLAMAQSAYQWRALEPRLALHERVEEIAPALARGEAVLWLPLALRRDAPDARTHWAATADTLAFDLARQLDAAHLVLVKRCAIPPAASLQALAAAGIIDAPLAALAREAELPTTVLTSSALDALAELLAARA